MSDSDVPIRPEPEVPPSDDSISTSSDDSDDSTDIEEPGDLEALLDLEDADDLDADDLDADDLDDGTETDDETARLTRRGRVRKWDRAPQPHDWRWYTGNVGKALIAAGLLMFAFVGYQLYGTAIETAAAQNQLEDDFARQLEQFDQPEPDDVVVQAPVVTDPPEVVVTDPPEVVVTDPAEEEPQPDDTPVVTDPPEVEEQPDETPVDTVAEPVPVDQQIIPEVEDGDALARLQIPAIDTDDIIVAGVGKSDLKKGPGHFPDTPLPGQLGNTAIAGHRTTFGQPFRNVDQLAIGDEIRVTTLNGEFVYLVTDQQIVSPADYQVIATSDPTVATITLVSCHPVFTARERIVIFGELDIEQSSPVGAPLLNYGRDAVAAPTEELPGEDDEPTETSIAPTTTEDPAPTTTGGSATTVATTEEPADEEPAPDTTVAAPAPLDDGNEVGSDQANANIADAFSESWFSDPSANPQVGLWGVALAAIAIAAYAISRRFRRDLIGLAIGLVPFLLALYFFFQNVNRLLPPNL
jgi:sortase A